MENSKFYCKYCGREIKNKGSHEIHEKYCKFNPTNKELYEPYEYHGVCEKCGKNFIKVIRTKKLFISEYKNRGLLPRFCSRSCANGHSHSDETKEKIRESVIKYNLENPKLIKLSVNKIKEEKYKKNQINKGIKKMCSKTTLYSSIELNNTEKKYITKECRYHGLTNYVYVNSEQRYRCVKCRSEATQKRRDKTKELLVEYKGGKCEICGYNKCIGALEFHHKNPFEKDFGIAAKGYTRSIEKNKEEVDKCILVCANCHREIHEKLKRNKYNGV